ncbi:MAG: SMC-Scp complex subunit ScpB [bacterium]|nr:SMC-Scp complex subunit ScpB [bacterium]
MQKLPQTIESLLFVLGEPTSFKRLAVLTGASDEEVMRAVDELSASLIDRGIRLVRTENSAGLVTAPESSKIISEVMKEEFSGDLSRAALETLAIIIYKGSASRPDVDYVRGVNSSFTMRNLLVRGLVLRTPHPTDARSYIYRPSVDLLKYFGISRIEDIPEYERIRSELQKQKPEEEAKEGDTTKEKNN